MSDEASAPSDPPPERTPAPRRRFGRRLLTVAAASAGGLLAIIGGTWGWLHTASGEQWLRRTVLQAAGEAIHGRLELETLALDNGALAALLADGALRLRLEGVRLTAPDDALPAVEIKSLVVEAALRPLLDRKLRVPLLAVDTPVVRLVSGPEGTNLARALAPRHPAPESPPGETPELLLDLPDVRVDAGRFVREGDGRIELDGLTLRLRVSGPLRSPEVAAELALQAHAPVALPVKLSTHLALEDDAKGGARLKLPELVLDAGGSYARISAEATTDARNVQLTLHELRLQPDEAALLLPKEHLLLGEVVLAGDLRVSGPEVATELRATLPAGSVRLAAEATLPASGTGAEEQRRLDRWALTLDVDDVAPQRIVGGLPEALVNARIKADGKGLPGEGVARASVALDGSRYRSLPIERAAVEASAEGRKLRLKGLELRAAGVRLDVDGVLEEQRHQLHGTLALPSLAASLDAIGPLLPESVTLPALRGDLALTFDSEGRHEAPVVAADLRARSLSLPGETTLTGLQVKLQAEPHPSGDPYARTPPKVTAQLSLERAKVPGTALVEGVEGTLRLDELSPLAASVDGLKIRAFEASGYRGRSLEVDAHVVDEDVELDLSGELTQGASGWQPVRVGVSAAEASCGRRSCAPGEQRWRVDRLALEALGLTLASESSFAVAHGPDGSAVDGLRLGGTLGRLSVDGRLASSGAIEAEVDLSQLALSRLPAGLLPAELGRRGELALHAAVDGTVDHPQGEVRFSWLGAHPAALAALSGPVDLELSGRLQGGELALELDAGLPAAGQVRLQTNVTLSGDLKSIRDTAPLTADLQLQQLSVPVLARLLPEGTLPPEVVTRLAGALHGSVKVAGTAAEPELDVKLRGEGLGDGRISDAQLAVELAATGGELRAQVDVTRPGIVSSRIALQAPLDIGQLIATGKPPDLQQLPIDGSVQLALPDLRQLDDVARAFGQPAPQLSGRLTVDGNLTGGLGAPSITLTVEGDRLDQAGAPDATDGLGLRLKATADGKAAALSLGASVPGALDLQLDGRTPLDLARLLASGALPELRTLPLEGSLRLALPDLSRLLTQGPLRRRLQPLLAGQLSQLSGALTTQVRLAGGLERPTLDLDLEGHDLAAIGPDVHVDNTNVHVTMAGGDEAVRTTLQVDQPGVLALRVEGAVSNSLSALLREETVDVEQLPLTGQLQLELPDLAGLRRSAAAMGVALPEELAGAAQLQAELDGSLARPRVKVALDAQRLAVAGRQGLGASVALTADERVVLDASVTRQQHAFVESHVGLEKPVAALRALSTAQWLDVPLELRATVHPTPLAALRGGSPAASDDVGGAASLKLAIDGPVGALRGTLTSQVTGLKLAGGLQGRAHATVVLTPGEVKFSARADTSGASGGDGTVTVAASLTGPVGLSALAAAGGFTGDPALLASALESGVAVLRRAPIEGAAQSDGLDLRLLEGLSDSLQKPSGKLALSIRADGSVDDPHVSGGLTLRDGSAELPGTGRLSQLRLAAAVSETRVTLEELSGRLGRGSFRVEGDAAVRPASRPGEPEEAGGWGGQLHVRLDQLPITRNYQTRGFLTLKADAAEWRYRRGLLKIPRLLLSEGLLSVPDKAQKSVQSLDDHPRIRIRGRAAEEPTSGGLRMEARVEIPDDFRIEAPLGNTLTLGADLLARYDRALNVDGLGSFDLEGKVRVPAGRLQVLQAAFELRPQSVLVLPSRTWDNPVLDLTAVHASQGVEVTARLTGPLDDMQRQLRATPEMDEGEIFYFIATGQRQQRASSDPFSVSQESLDDTVSGLVGSVGSTFAKAFLKTYLGPLGELDVLSVDTRGNARVGKHLWNGRLYLGAQVRPNANTLAGENSAELNAEYRLSEHSYSRLRVGDQGSGGAEVMYQDSVPAESQKKAVRRVSKP